MGEGRNMKKEIYPKLFTWLFVGLLITFIGGYSLSLNQQLMYSLLTIGYILKIRMMSRKD